MEAMKDIELVLAIAGCCFLVVGLFGNLWPFLLGVGLIGMSEVASAFASKD